LGIAALPGRVGMCPAERLPLAELFRF